MQHARELLWQLSIAAELVALGVLLRRRLANDYHWFVILLAAQALREGWLFLFAPHDAANPRYANVWLLTEPLLLLFEVMAVVELFGRISAHYRNFERCKKFLVGIWFTSGASAAALLMYIQWRHSRWPAWFYEASFVSKRVVEFGLLFFLLQLVIFTSVFRVPMRRNVRVHQALMTAFVGIEVAVYIGIFSHLGFYWPGIAELVGDTACWIAWASLMTRNGEIAPPYPPYFGPSEEELDRRGKEVLRRLRSLRW